MPLGKDLCELRQAFFGSVLLITGKEDDVFAFAGTVLALIDDGVSGASGGSQKEQEAESSYPFFHNRDV